jgi:hypothetical protein
MDNIAKRRPARTCTHTKKCREEKELEIQGGSDISGTIAKFHLCIKKSYFVKKFCAKQSQLFAVG